MQYRCHRITDYRLEGEVAVARLELDGLWAEWTITPYDEDATRLAKEEISFAVLRYENSTVPNQLEIKAASEGVIFSATRHNEVLHFDSPSGILHREVCHLLDGYLDWHKGENPKIEKEYLPWYSHEHDATSRAYSIWVIHRSCNRHVRLSARYNCSRNQLVLVLSKGTNQITFDILRNATSCLESFRELDLCIEYVLFDVYREE